MTFSFLCFLPSSDEAQSVIVDATVERGEPGSLSIQTCVCVDSVTDADGQAVALLDDDDCQYVQRQAEQRALRLFNSAF